MKREYDNPNEVWKHPQPENRQQGSYRACLWYVLAVFITIMLTIFLSGCRTIQYVPVETVKTEYVTKTDTFLQKDSIVFHDSVYIHSKGDTVWYEKWHTKYKDKIVTKIVVDSFIKTDSIQVPYPVEKKLTRWQKIKMDAGGGAIIALFFVVIFIVIRFLVKIRQ